MMCAAETNMGQISYNNQKSAWMEKKGIKKKIRMKGGINIISRGILNPAWTPLPWAARVRSGIGNWGVDASRLLGVCLGWGLGEGETSLEAEGSSCGSCQAHPGRCSRFHLGIPPPEVLSSLSCGLGLGGSAWEELGWCWVLLWDPGGIMVLTEGWMSRN